MKTIFKTMTCGVVAAAALGAFAAEQTAEQKAAEAKAKAEWKASEDAWKKLDKDARALMAKDFKEGGFACYWHDNIDKARELYETALTNAVLKNAHKIQAVRQAAQMHLEATRDGDAALAEMEQAFKIPGLSADDRKAAEAARKSLRVLMRLEKPDPSAEAAKPPEPKKDANYFRNAFAGVEKARESAAREKDRVLNDYLPFIANQSFDAFTKQFEAVARELDEKYPSVDIYRKLRNSLRSWHYSQNPWKATLDPRFRLFMIECMEKSPEKRRFTPAEMVAWADGDVPCQAKGGEYGAKVLELAKDPAKKISADAVKAAHKAVAFKDVGTDAAKVPAAVAAYFAAIGKADDKVGQAELLVERATAWYKLGDEAGAQLIWDARAKLIPPRPQAKLDCFWWKDAPHDIRGIVDSATYKNAPKGLLNRKYGSNLEFLILTDSALTGRKMTADDGKEFRPTELVAFCDELGVKLLFRAYLDNMADVKAGLADVPGYETYLATGIDDPYHCLMFDPSEGGKPDDSFVTQYDNATGYRNVNTKIGNLQYTNLYLDDSVVTLIAIPWASTFASIPSKSPAWYFEALNWCHGGLSWGGSVSVHQRSSFGELKFTGVDAAALTAIKRRLLLAGKRVYQETQSPSNYGFLEIWKDPQLGDQEFWRAEVKPFADRLWKCCQRIKKDMSDADVNEIYDASGEDLFNAAYVVAQKRTRWLQKKMTE